MVLLCMDSDQRSSFIGKERNDVQNTYQVIHSSRSLSHWNSNKNDGYGTLYCLYQQYACRLWRIDDCGEVNAIANSDTSNSSNTNTDVRPNAEAEAESNTSSNASTNSSASADSPSCSCPGRTCSARFATIVDEYRWTSRLQ